MRPPGGRSHSVRGGGAGLPSGTGADPAQDHLLELPRLGGGHQALQLPRQRVRRRVRQGRAPLQVSQAGRRTENQVKKRKLFFGLAKAEGTVRQSVRN